MDMFRKFKSIFGYENNDDEKNKIDSYGVDHSNFSLRDEIEYQMARNNREEQFMALVLLTLARTSSR